jgi:hypothetical protein
MYRRRPPTIIRVEAGFGVRSFNCFVVFFEPDFAFVVFLGGVFLAMFNPFGAGRQYRARKSSPQQRYGRSSSQVNSSPTATDLRWCLAHSPSCWLAR